MVQIPAVLHHPLSQIVDELLRNPIRRQARKHPPESRPAGVFRSGVGLHDAVTLRGPRIRSDQIAAEVFGRTASDPGNSRSSMTFARNAVLAALGSKPSKLKAIHAPNCRVFFHASLHWM